jgi:hypothetical protein
MKNTKSLYTIDVSTTPPSCLPTNLDYSNLVDVTRLCDPWRRYLDTQTGRVHDGLVYAEAFQQLIQDQT